MPPADRREFFASEPLVDKNSVNPNKPVSIALDEIAEGKIAYHRTRESIK
jgi:DNA-directed RNA polymerase subunit K/omega